MKKPLSVDPVGETAGSDSNKSTCVYSFYSRSFALKPSFAYPHFQILLQSFIDSI